MKVIKQLKYEIDMETNMNTQKPIKELKEAIDLNFEGEDINKVETMDLYFYKFEADKIIKSLKEENEKLKKENKELLTEECEWCGFSTEQRYEVGGYLHELRVLSDDYDKLKKEMEDIKKENKKLIARQKKDLKQIDLLLGRIEELAFEED